MTFGQRVSILVLIVLAMAALLWVAAALLIPQGTQHPIG